MPGVVAPAEPDSVSRAWGGFVNGNRTDANSLSVDGMGQNQIGVARNLLLSVSQDSVSEVKILLSNYQAEYGRYSGANVQVITKSGTRDFHGLFSYFKRHEQFNANSYFNNRLGITKPRYRYNTWNYNVGGPLYIPGKFNRNRDKLFFFWSQEFWPIRTTNSGRQATMPTTLERAGDFSQSVDQNGALIPIVDPTNRQPFPGNRIPVNRLDPSGQVLLNVFPQRALQRVQPCPVQRPRYRRPLRCARQPGERSPRRVYKCSESQDYAVSDPSQFLADSYRRERVEA